MARGRSGDIAEVVVFDVGSRGELIEVDAEAEIDVGGDAAEIMHRVGQGVKSGYERVKEYEVPRDTRFGLVADKVVRGGSREDVVTPVFVEPFGVLRRLADQSSPVASIDRLRIDLGSMHQLGRGLAWTGLLRTGPFTHRAATLRLSPSPSTNLLIVELVPIAPRIIATRAFVRAGIDVVDRLCRQICAVAGVGAALR